MMTKPYPVPFQDFRIVDSGILHGLIEIYLKFKDSIGTTPLGYPV